MQRFNPFDYPLCWAFPRRLAPSQWTEHVPCALFLIEALRPRTVVELGTHYGVSYCAFCQGIQAVGLDAKAYAVDTWQGDPHSGLYGSEVLDDLRRHHDPLYGSFSRLVPSTFDEARAHFPDGSVDLLHIDGWHTYEAVRHDFESWLPKVSDRGVVLLHDTEVREGDFGVWRFWDEVRSRYPSFTFVHQHGLGVLAVGSTYPEALRPLFDHPEDTAPLREFFAQLGQRVSCRLDKERAVQDLTALIRAKEAEMREVWATRDRENQELWAQICQRDRVLQERDTELHECDSRLREREKQLQERDTEIRELTAQVTEQHGALEEMASQAAVREAVIEVLKAEQHEHTADMEQTIRGLTDMLKKREQEVQRTAVRFAARDQEAQALQQQVTTRDREAQTLQHQLTALTTSRSWRLAQAVRAAARPVRLAHRAWRVWKDQGTRVVLRKVGRRLTWRGGAAAATGQDLRFFPDQPLQTWRVGKGNVLYLSGACYHPEFHIRQLKVLMNGTAFPVAVSQIYRPDLFQLEYPASDPRGHSLASGFYALVPLAECPERTTAHVALWARLANGATCQRSLADLAIQPAEEPGPRLALAADDQPRARIAICMTTFNPSLELFTRQLQSIKDQTNREWICLINDDCSRPEVFQEIVRLTETDPRFQVQRNPERLGFYHNFEQCLARVPADVEYVALSDHDDSWHPDKLDALLAAFDAETTLVYSDMNIVDRAGKRIASTYWTTRRNNYQDLASLFLANTVTGAASMFRRELLDYVLPFPDKIGLAFHDHWIACAALTLGKIGYVDRPLYDYVQHGANVIGHFVQPRQSWPALGLRLLKTLSPVNIRGRLRALRDQAKAIYLCDVLRIQHLAGILRLRGAGRVTPAKRRTLDRLARLDRSAPWLLARGLFGLRRRSVTMGAETYLLRGVGWRRAMGIQMWLRARRSSPAPALAAQLQGPAVAPVPSVPSLMVHALERVEAIERKIAPLPVQVTSTAPRRVNLVIPTIDFRYVFGGYITKFNLARRLAEAGRRVRLILVDDCDYQPERWRQQLRAYPGLDQLLDQVEITCAADRAELITFHPQDALIATTWWTAHIAHHAARALNRPHFVYLIQEFETFTFPMGAYAALADQSYTFPHRAVFSTEFLRDYFRQQRLGVFAEGRLKGERHSVAFENTITAVGSVTVPDIAGRSPRKLLYYARPEPHAARNMFELGMAALTRAVEAGYFDLDWEFYGIGAVETAGKIPLPGSRVMHLLPRQSQETYREVLRDHDLGLSLMYTPHPSLVPIEMASAGMLTVTNAWGNKTAERLREISNNLIAVAPTIEGVQEGLRYAVANVTNYEQRVRGARVRWATNWDEAFPTAFLARLQEFMDARGDEFVVEENGPPCQAA